jgi:hypothetical protein
VAIPVLSVLVKGVWEGEDFVCVGDEVAESGEGNLAGVCAGDCTVISGTSLALLSVPIVLLPILLLVKSKMKKPFYDKRSVFRDFVLGDVGFLCATNE